LSGSDPEILCLRGACDEETLRVGLLEEEPLGVIQTRNPGVVDFEASLQWPPGWEGEVSVIHVLPPLDNAGATGSLREWAGPDLTTLSGDLRSTDEESLSSAVEEALRAVASAAAVREALLRTRVRRVCGAWSPSAGAVRRLARRLREAGVRVGFGASLGPAPAGVDVMVGCREGREPLLEALGHHAESGSSG